MIQEISPHLLNNAYQPLIPMTGDSLLFFSEKGVLCLGNSEILYPSAGDFPARLPDLTYLFDIDGKRFFRAYDDADAPAPLGGRYLQAQELRYLKPRHLAFAGVLGLQLNSWYLSRRYCGRCGTENSHDSEERAMTCPACGRKEYPSLMPAVIVGVVSGDRLLLTKYAGRIKPNWALVAGYAEIGETLEECVAREVLEETGLKVKDISYYKSQPWPFSSSLLVGFFARAVGDDEIKRDARELAEAVFVSRDDIDVAYDGAALTNEMICAFKKLGPTPLIRTDPLRQSPYEAGT